MAIVENEFGRRLLGMEEELDITYSRYYAAIKSGNSLMFLMI